MSNRQPAEYLGYTEWKTWDAAAFGTFTATDNAAYSHEIRRAGIVLNSKSLVLEIGFGNGSFAGWARERTAHYVGTEANRELIESASRAGFEAHGATLNLATITNVRKFNVIAMFDVLEHLEK